jgi:Polyketide cyclase / dehydrase and lipid transport
MAVTDGRVEFEVRTRWTIPGSTRAVWPLLCDSRMDTSGNPLFSLGIPRPVRCQLPAGTGGVGSERECVSDQGAIHQRIVEWVPERRLAFAMESTDLAFHRYVERMSDTIDLAADGSTVTLTRTTRVRVRGPSACWRVPLLYLGIKQVHRFVFANWTRLALASN